MSISYRLIGCRFVIYGTNGKPNVIDYRHIVSPLDDGKIADRIKHVRLDINQSLCFLSFDTPRFISLAPLLLVRCVFGFFF